MAWDVVPARLDNDLYFVWDGSVLLLLSPSTYCWRALVHDLWFHCSSNLSNPSIPTTSHPHRLYLIIMSPKHDVVQVTMNSNSYHVTLMEPLEQVESMYLEYFKIVNLPLANFIPKFLYLDIQGLRDRPKLNLNKTNGWTSTVISPPSAHGYPLYFKLDNEFVPGVQDTYRVVHGWQKKMGFHVGEMNRVSDFKVTINNEAQIPIPFAADTVAQLVFKVRYLGKRNLDPNEQVRQYSKFQN